MAGIRGWQFAFVFCYSLLAIMWLGVWLLRLDVTSSAQVAGFAGALLLAIEVIGDQRKVRIDEFLVRNVDALNTHLDAIASTFLLVKSRSQEVDPGFYGGSRHELLMYYLACVADLLLVVGFLKWGAPFFFGISGRELLRALGWKLHLIYIAPILTAWGFIFLSGRARKALWYPLLGLWGVSFLAFGWIVVPWLVFVVFTYALFKVLIFVLRIKKRFALGNIFVVVGFVLVVYSFAVFVSRIGAS